MKSTPAFLPAEPEQDRLVGAVAFKPVAANTPCLLERIAMIAAISAASWGAIFVAARALLG